MVKENIKSIEVMLDTVEHSYRTARIAYNIATKMKLTDTETFNIFLGALLHDVGKLNLDQDILGIPGTLTKDQYEYIKQHSVFSYKLLNNTKNKKIPEEVKRSIYNHHERIDGSGYNGTKDIDLGTRIVAIADVYDALTYKRVYRNQEYTHEGAISIMRKQKGFDDKVLNVLDIIGPINTCDMEQEKMA